MWQYSRNSRKHPLFPWEMELSKSWLASAPTSANIPFKTSQQWEIHCRQISRQKRLKKMVVYSSCFVVDPAMQKFTLSSGQHSELKKVRFQSLKRTNQPLIQTENEDFVLYCNMFVDVWKESHLSFTVSFWIILICFNASTYSTEEIIFRRGSKHLECTVPTKTFFIQPHKPRLPFFFLILALQNQSISFQPDLAPF